MYDSAITLQANGVEFDSFTVNASEAKTIDIPVPSNTSDLNNDSGFITESDIPAIPSKVSELDNDAGYITMSAIPAIPSKTSELDNDSGFITASAIPSQISSFENDVGYITASQVKPTTDSRYVGWADGAKQTVILEGTDSSGFPYNQKWAQFSNEGSFVVIDNVYAPWSLSEYNGTTFDPATEMTFGYRGTVMVKIGARTRGVAINAYCWAGGRYLIKAELDDTYYQPTQFGWINNSGVVEWYETTFNSYKTSIETVGGQSGIITCTRDSYYPTQVVKNVAYTDQIPSSVSQLTNDAGYITASAIPSDISAFENDVGYLSAVTWNDVSGKPNIPSNTSDLVNDSGFITASAIPSNVSQLNNDSGYVTASTVAASYYNKTEIDGMIGSINTILDNINGEVI